MSFDPYEELDKPLTPPDSPKAKAKKEVKVVKEPVKQEIGGLDNPHRPLKGSDPKESKVSSNTPDLAKADGQKRLKLIHQIANFLADDRIGPKLKEREYIAMLPESPHEQIC
jgi:hypothetical protein